MRRQLSQQGNVALGRCPVLPGRATFAAPPQLHGIRQSGPAQCCDCALDHSLEGSLRLTARSLPVIAIWSPEMRKKKWCLAIKEIAAPG
jgi:hypothetical protein